ncbi:hypothetical protein PoB_002093200 [Plakobranchus ocellatus]|uniref:Uncharacterized protein n=1 Tax=Plakobranchus ocellatus TaxID=259542 RepID=A0AAV3ZGJ3_9GAST|nr:hypothetical protein PoB_002093200 [Plakobranchus ocellatus]
MDPCGKPDEGVVIGGAISKAHIGLKISKHDNSHAGFEVFVYITYPRQDNLKLSGAPSGQGVGGMTRTRGRRVPADHSHGGSLFNMPPMSPAFVEGLELRLLQKAREKRISFKYQIDAQINHKEINMDQKD